MLAREHLWQLVPHRDGGTPGRRWTRYGYILAVPLLLALEAAAAVKRYLRVRPGGKPARLSLFSADAAEVVRWRERRRAAAFVRYRFRRGRRAAAALGGMLAGVVVAWQLAELIALQGGVDGASGLGALVLVALGVVGPWLLVDLARRWGERRRYWDWQ